MSLLGTISNSDSGLDVRTLLNSAIALLNGTGTAAGALTGTELLPGVQAGTNKNISANQIATFVAAGLGALASLGVGTGLASSGGNLNVSGLTTAQFAANVVDTDATLAANSATRIAAQSAVKSYVDNLLTGLAWKQAVRAFITTNISVSSAPSSIDGVTLTSGDRVALGGQTTGSQNGIYIFNGAGSAMTRATDADSGAELISATFFVKEGTTYHDTQWTVSNDAITLGSTAITVVQVSGAGTYSNGAGLALSGNQFSISAGGVTNTMLAGSIDLTAKVTGVLPFANGGTGQSAYTDGQLLIGNTATGGLSKATLTAGSNITITNGNGTISIAAAGGSPGGADTNVQFNSSSAFGGDSGFTYAGTGQATLALGTITANAKALNITGTFNNAAVTFDAPFFMNIVDTASNANSLLLDVQVSSSSKLKLRKDGVLHKVPDGSYPAPDFKMGSLGAGLSASYGGAFTWSRDGSTGTISGHAQSGWGLILNSSSDNSKFGWSSDPGPTTGDLFLSRDAAAILAQRNGTNAQASRIYETYTDASNNSMLRFDACKTTAVVHRIMSEANGTGTLRNIAIDGFSKSGAPTSTQLPAGTFGVFKDSGGGGVVIAYNDGGTIKTAALT